ncbi:MAG: hypothetical protein HYV36_08540 [Lentisphaerae bacterium]|nr:hypothetical protein [Lentisphaerota bacterium]
MGISGCYTLLNVNIPNKPLKELQDLLVTRVGRSRFAEIFHRRTAGGAWWFLVNPERTKNDEPRTG